MNEMATLFGMVLIGSSYFAAYRLNSGRVESAGWRLLSYAGWSLALIGTALVIKDWWDVHTLYRGLAKSIGSTGAKDFLAQYHIAFPRANGFGLTGVYVLLASAVISMITSIRAVSICGPQMLVASLNKALGSSIAKHLGRLGRWIAYMAVSVLSVFAWLWGESGEENDDKAGHGLFTIPRNKPHPFKVDYDPESELIYGKWYKRDSD